MPVSEDNQRQLPAGGPSPRGPLPVSHGRHRYRDIPGGSGAGGVQMGGTFSKKQTQW